MHGVDLNIALSKPIFNLKRTAKNGHNGNSTELLESD